MEKYAWKLVVKDGRQIWIPKPTDGIPLEELQTPLEKHLLTKKSVSIKILFVDLLRCKFIIQILCDISQKTFISFILILPYLYFIWLNK